MNNTISILNIDCDPDVSLICDRYRIIDNTVDFVVYNRFDSLDSFINSNNNKIAIIRLWMIDQYPIEQLIKSVLPHCSYVILFLPEGTECILDIVKQLYCPRLILFFCGFCDTQLKTTPYMEWFYRTLHQPNIDNLSLLTPFDVKPKYFDILLGHKNPARTTVFDHIINSGYADINVLTYMNIASNAMNIFERDETSFIMPDDGITPIVNNYTTTDQVLYKGHHLHLSTIIPISIYNQTAYSFVVETQVISDGVCFMTEKIVKPILAKRLFLVVAVTNYLQNLRKLGFQTFDGIIDETYDTEENSSIRINMILEQLEYLISQPQHEILEKIKPIVEHNQRHMLNFTRERGLVGISTYIQKTINRQ